ncbi:MAG: metallophosphoesterase [Planctomycetota bacterium]
MFEINKVVLLSDTEIDFLNSKKINGFKNFLLKVKEIKKDTLIVGDFFEYYTGREILHNSYFKEFLSFLKGEGIKIYLIPGNRESLIKNSRKFEENNFYILDSYVEIKEHGQTILLTHGDEILEQKISHFLFKKTLNHIKEKNIEEAVPYPIKNLIARILRRISRGNSRREKNSINLNFLLKLYRYDTIIIGHYDIPKEININFQNRITRIYILGKWKPSNPVLIFENRFKWIKI